MNGGEKMNKENGFTLIELLAIIVILAIIAVITVPIILNIIDEARSGARKNSVIGYGKAVELAYTKYEYERQLNNGTNTVLASNVEKNASDTAKDGKVISIIIDDSTDPINLKVQYDGDSVVCSPTGTDNNLILSGRVSLKNCKVNDTGDLYDYSDGKASLVD